MMSLVRPARDALTHEHARARRRLEHVIDALCLQRGTLLVRARTDLTRHLLRRGRLHVQVRHRRLWTCGWTQVRLAPHQDHGDRRPADRAHFFYPLVIRGKGMY